MHMIIQDAIQRFKYRNDIVSCGGVMHQMFKHMRAAL